MTTCNPFFTCFGFAGESLISPCEIENNLKFSDVFQVQEKLGEGGYAVVMKAQCIQDKESRHFAVKIVAKENLKPKDEIALRQEFEILKRLSHSCVVQVFQFFDECEYFYVVMEYLEGGELFDRIVRKTRYNEAEARDVVFLLLQGIKYCHDNDIVHRDLKPENLLLTSVEDDSSLKIADFGLALNLLGMDAVSVSKSGTPDYIAPEVIDGKPIGKPVDMWSFGVIMFILLGGYPPFHDANQKLLFSKICTGSFRFHPKRWSNVSEAAKDMITRLLNVDPRHRLTASEAMCHEWITQDAGILSNNILDDNLPELKKFNASRKLRVGIKAVMALNSFLKVGSVKEAENLSIESPLSSRSEVVSESNNTII